MSRQTKAATQRPMSKQVPNSLLGKQMSRFFPVEKASQVPPILAFSRAHPGTCNTTTNRPRTAQTDTLE